MLLSVPLRTLVVAQFWHLLSGASLARPLTRKPKPKFVSTKKPKGEGRQMLLQLLGREQFAMSSRGDPQRSPERKQETAMGKNELVP